MVYIGLPWFFSVEIGKVYGSTMVYSVYSTHFERTHVYVIFRRTVIICHLYNIIMYISKQRPTAQNIRGQLDK